MIYYIADTHLNDQSIFDKCKRPFENVYECTNEIIKRWNKKVLPNDTVYVLGDIINNDIKTIETFKLLNGHKHLIIGNHDQEFQDYIAQAKVFETIKYMDLIEDNGRTVHICHYPLMDWMEFNRNGYHVYGHIHNKTGKQGQAYVKIKEYYSTLKAYNCGVDVTNFEPVTLDEMIKLKEDNKNEPYIN